MAKWFGMIGYLETRESMPGVWAEEVSEREYYGDMTRNHKRSQPSEQLNDDISVNGELSIVCDPYALENFHAIRYVTYLGTKWKVSGVEVAYPRLILQLGGVYNGPEA